MKIWSWRIAIVVLSLAFAHSSFAQQAVLQRGYDAGLSGANLSESSLTTANVTPSTFGLLRTLPVDANVYAQPLYVPNVNLAGQGTHNVLYVASMNDTLYAFDADSGAQLWSVNLATSVGATPALMQNFAFSGNQNIVGNIGILSTPVIDGSTGLLYVVAATLESNTIAWRLHVIDITSGTEPLPNVQITGSYATVPFDGRYQTQRASLTLAAGQVIIGFGALESEYSGGFSGWVMAYSKQTLAQTGIFATVAGGTRGGGVWQSGRAPVVDSAGFVYVFTGNGYTNGYNGTNSFSESALKLDPANGLALIDWFTPANWSTLDGADKDLSSSGPLLVPSTGLLAGGGKDGTFFLLNSGNLGHSTAGDTGVLQKSAFASFRGGPVYWQRSAANGGPLLYNWGSNDTAKAYAFNGSTFASTPNFQGSVAPVYPGGILALSALADTPGTGILWATIAPGGNVYEDPTDPGVLYALDASNVGTTLWTSAMNASRDALGNFAKLVPPTIANGKVYVATFSNRINVYGLLPTPNAAPPAFSPAPGAYTGTQQVSLADTTPGAVIHYTSDGTTPTAASPTYGGTPLTVSVTSTLQAIATAIGYTNSAIAGGTYTISAPVTTVSVGLAAAANVVGIGKSGTPVTNGGLDTGGNAFATDLLGSSLNWAGSTFALGAAGAPNAASFDVITLPQGAYSAVKLLATAVNGNQVNQSYVVTYTDGSTSTVTQSMSDWFKPQSYPGESIALSMAYRLTPTGAQDPRPFNLYGYSLAINPAKTVKSLTLPKNRSVVVFAVDLVPASSTPTAATPVFAPAPGTYGSAQQVTLTDPTPGAVIHYTTDGSTPTGASPTYGGTPLTVSTTSTVQAIANASGYANSAVGGGTYTISAQGVSVAVGLSASLNVVGIGKSGTAVGSGGIDGGGAAFATDLLGTSLGWAGSTFTLGAAGGFNAVSGNTVSLPQGTYSAVKLLATGVNGSQANQGFVVTYTDGTTTTVTQSISDWFRPQNYPGESIASTMAYRLLASGAQDPRPFNLYGYSLAINPAKTVKSIALPKSRNVVVLAIDLIPTGTPVVATPTFSPAPGNYGAAQQVTLADITSGAVIHYTTDGTVPTGNSPTYVSGSPIPVNATGTLQVIAVANGYTNSAVASGTYTISASVSTVNVALPNANVVAIGATGTPVPSGGIDTKGYAYATEQLGSSLSWQGAAFNVGAAGAPNAIANAVVPLPGGMYSRVLLLGTGVNGNQVAQTVTVTYTDGTTTRFTQSFSDWYAPQYYGGESIASTMAYRLLPGGAQDPRAFNLYGYAFAIDASRTVSSITLPAVRNVVVLAVDLVP